MWVQISYEMSGQEVIFTIILQIILYEKLNNAQIVVLSQLDIWKLAHKAPVKSRKTVCSKHASCFNLPEKLM